MGITMVLTQVLTPTPMSNPQQKYMGYAMSVFFSLLMLNLPSGLTLYIFVNNVSRSCSRCGCAGTCARPREQPDAGRLAPARMTRPTGPGSRAAIRCSEQRC